MSTDPAARHVVRLEFTHALAAPTATVRLIRSVLTAHPGCDLAATEFAVTVGIPVALATEQSLAEVARQVDAAIAGLGLPDHAVSTFSWVRASGAVRRAAGGRRWPELPSAAPAITAKPPRWLGSPPLSGTPRSLATVG